MKAEIFLMALLGFGAGAAAMAIVGARMAREIRAAKGEVLGVLERVARAAERL